MDKAGMTVKEFRVVGFPPGAPRYARAARSAEHAEEIVKENPEDYPLIETRMVTVTDWRIVRADK